MRRKRKAIDPEKEFKKVEKMLYKLAWNATGPNFPFEEAQSEVFWAFMQACKSFDPDRDGGMKFSSWVYFKITLHLKSVMTRRIRRQPPLVFMEIKDDLLPSPRVRSEIREVLAARPDMSDEAKEFLGLLLDPPPSFRTLEFSWDEMKPISPVKLLRQVEEHMHFEYGKDRVRCQMIMMEIEDCLKRKKIDL